MSEPTVAAQWADLKAALQRKMDEGYSQLDKVSVMATETLDDRISKVDGPMAEILKRCRDSVAINVKSASAQKQFILKQLTVEFHRTVIAAW